MVTNRAISQSIIALNDKRATQKDLTDEKESMKPETGGSRDEEQYHIALLVAVDMHVSP